MDLIERCGDWYLSIPATRESGEGFFWELLQEAKLLNENLEELDPETEAFEKLYEICCCSMGKLLEMFSRAIDHRIVLSSYQEKSQKYKNDILGPYGATHECLHWAIQFLVILASTLPEIDVQYGVVRILFNLEPFIDFQKSDSKARAMILSSAFQIIDILQKRKMDITEPRSLLLELLTSLLQESKTIHEMFKLSTFKETPFFNPSFITPSETRLYLERIQSANNWMLEICCMHIQRLMAYQLAMEETQNVQSITFWFDFVLSILVPNPEISINLKEAAVNVLKIGLSVIQRMTTEEVLTQTMAALMERVVPVLDDYICWHLPQRSNQAFPIPRNEAEIEVRKSSLVESDLFRS